MTSVDFFVGRDPKSIQIWFTKFISLPPEIFVVAMEIIMATKKRIEAYTVSKRKVKEGRQKKCEKWKKCVLFHQNSMLFHWIVFFFCCKFRDAKWKCMNQTYDLIFFFDGRSTATIYHKIDKFMNMITSSWQIASIMYSQQGSSNACTPIVQNYGLV